jgi:hypothetical protein
VEEARELRVSHDRCVGAPLLRGRQSVEAGVVGLKACKDTEVFSQDENQHAPRRILVSLRERSPSLDVPSRLL